MTVTQDTQNTQVQNQDQVQEEQGLDLELVVEYQKLTEVESAIKKRKKEIRDTISDYLRENNLTETPPYKNLIAVLEERTTYGLNPFIMEATLPASVFRNIVNKKIDLEKVKREFVNNNIPIQLLRTAEVSETKEAFAVRKANRVERKKKTIPFWKLEEEG